MTLPVSDPPGSTDKPYDGWLGPIDPGSVSITIDAADYYTYENDFEQLSLTVVGQPSLTIEYDENGNTTSISDGTNTTDYTWDAADQLRRIDYHDGTATEFEYDAMGRRVRIVELDAFEQETSSKYFLWDGLSIVEERNGGTPTTVTSSYFAEGEVRSGTKYIYGRDHLGSVREVVDVSATTDTVVARYDYDPYGRREVVSETVAFDWGFTGHYYHADSGLHLAPFRAYDADLGRWLSRDPLGEAGGINLYEYALSNPVNFVDPLGLSVGDFFGGVLDGLTFGLSTMALGSSINQCSKAFSAGVWVGFGGSLVLTGGAGGVGFFAARAVMKGGIKSGIRRLLQKQATSSTTRVGRWMSDVEYSAMKRTGMVQQSRSGTTHVASPANPFAYQAQAPRGSFYVEFDVPTSSLKATQDGWAKILSPTTLEGRLAARKGLPVPQLPPATNILHMATKFR